jgi:primosomal protein N' (replication factor Y)
MRVIADFIAKGKQAIVLVPEIALTPQLTEMFRRRFGDTVAVTHYKLSNGEKAEIRRKAASGEISVVIGPRSAVFSPLRNLGVIVIDEEHDKSYKSELTPKYDAREVASKRAEIEGFSVIMGSATPSVEGYYRAVELNEYELITLNERVNRKMPETVVVDMRAELADGNRSVFSSALFEALEDALKHGEQAILFLNRRGHSTFISCRNCGGVLTCARCSVNFTYHMPIDLLICHYCGEKARPPSVCPSCQSRNIKYFGVGTQRIEDDLKSALPHARLLRMDADTTGKKGGHDKIIKQFADGEADILIGTQMVAKGLNFPSVSVVGIMAADTALNMGDFSSAETCYQLITQVSGRAGRAETDGTVYIQTYDPEHYSIKFAAGNNYAEFYGHEIAIRRAMDYPPFSHFLLVMFTGKDERSVILNLHILSGIMEKYNRKKFFTLYGPAPAAVSKIKDNYRHKLIVKGEDEELLKKFGFYCLDKLKVMKVDMIGITVSVTVDPASLA